MRFATRCRRFAAMLTGAAGLCSIDYWFALLVFGCCRPLALASVLPLLDKAEQHSTALVLASAHKARSASSSRRLVRKHLLFCLLLYIFFVLL